MMLKKIFGLILSVSLPLSSFGTGGSVVGNGAGIVENNFQFAYTSLASLVAQCMVSNCGLTPEEKGIARRMQRVLQINRSNSQRLIFVSEKKFPGFFDTGVSEKHRIAATGLNPESAIYVNLDLLYDENGKPALDYPTIVSILAHEVGHQTGEVDHAVLDILGSKLKQALNLKLSKHQLEMGPENSKIEVTIINHAVPLRTAEMIVSWEGAGSRRITPDLLEPLKCHEPATSMAGFEIQNGHFIYNENGQEWTDRFHFGATVHLYCFSRLDNSMTMDKFAVKIEIWPDLSMIYLEQLRLMPRTPYPIGL